jgi:hypothetical protein
MHFCDEHAREYGRFSRPKKVSLNWTIPAFVKNSVGSFAGMRELLLTLVWPFFSKYERNASRISEDFMQAPGS